MKKFPGLWFEQKLIKLIFGLTSIAEGFFYVLIVIAASIYTLSVNIAGYTKRRLK